MHPTRPFTRRTALAMVLASLASGALPALAQTKAAGHDKALRVILPLSAGSGADGAIRAISTPISKALGQTLVIENLPGAGGITGTAQIVRAPKDGDTIGIVSNNHAVNPSLYKNIPFDSIKDIAPITIIGTTPFVLVANPKVPARTVQELIAHAKAHPGTLNYGSSGNGTILHLGAAMFVEQAQIDVPHIPYKGMGQLMNDLLSGQVQLGVVAVAPAMAHIKAGNLRAIGITSAKRSASLPDVPTIAEQGLPQYELDGWIAAIAPAGVPKAEIDRLYQGFVQGIASPEAREALIAQGYEIQLTPPEVATRFMASEKQRMQAAVKAAQVKMD
ncbi:ABC transporter substrate-binding protein [Comamonas thiooxydans]|uniref:ABC transporter substrate-binding protein n=1 Tax=Comamonas thiooxydans TaxID=363952 RepID=A0A0E3BWF6_9BURK|nr:tripartite tricarboxylate transporter substrate binding protein [Comamonas thiooxydans]KGG84723.1 ABC transporter substrate-binding protein [Comamonas thiooxydans]